MTTPPRRIRGPRRRNSTATGARTIGVHAYPDTITALEQWAASHDLLPSGAAHVLLRQALGLPPITTTTNHE
jgi:hypothetical protein